MIECKYAKSTLNAVATDGVEVVANGYIPFATNAILTGASVGHVAGSNSVSLNKAGLYQVDVSASIETTAAETVVLSLVNNSAEVPGASNVVDTAAATSVPINITTIVQVNPSCCAINNTANLQVQVSEGVVVNSANIRVVKLA